MTIPVHCPECGKSFVVGDREAGRRVSCDCGYTMRVPGGDQGSFADSLLSDSDSPFNDPRGGDGLGPSSDPLPRSNLRSSDVPGSDLLGELGASGGSRSSDSGGSPLLAALLAGLGGAAIVGWHFYASLPPTVLNLAIVSAGGLLIAGALLLLLGVTRMGVVPISLGAVALILAHGFVVFQTLVLNQGDVERLYMHGPSLLAAVLMLALAIRVKPQARASSASGGEDDWLDAF